MAERAERIITTRQAQEAGEPALPVGEAILGPDGLLAGLLPGYEARRPQMEMANLTAEVLAAGQGATDDTCSSALIEAGTGVGKSLAYLIPAIMSGEKVIVSTDTIALQEQLVGKDLPFLQRHLPQPFTFAIAKGRGNWLCTRNSRALLGGGDALTEADAELALREFDGGRWDGDKSTLRLPITEGRWAALAGDDSCTGKKCPEAHTCPYLAAKAKAESADVVVTNHHMFLLSHHLPRPILPERDIWIADEAHTLADKACEVFGAEVSQFRVPALVKRISRQAKALPLEVLRSLPGEPAPRSVSIDTLIDFAAVNRANDALFRAFHGADGQQRLSALPPSAMDRARAAAATLKAALAPVRDLVYEAKGRFSSETQKEERWAAEAVERSIVDLNAELALVLAEDEDPDYVAYVELEAGGSMGGGQPKVTLHRKPIESGPIFKGILGTLKSAVFCSATLANGKGAAAWRVPARDLGMDPDEARTMVVGSPFDYARQVQCYLPKQMPEARAPEYFAALADEVERILHHTQGRAFVLFTSHRDMKAVHQLLGGRFRFPLLLQGELPKPALLEKYLAEPNSVLCATKSFWTGIDVPGERLSCVILAKLPFPNTKHPLTEARCQRIKEHGGSDFMEYSLPRCIQDVRQGFGRLIRNKTDTGVFAILDPRLRTARYGALIAQSLPAMRWRFDL